MRRCVIGLAVVLLVHSFRLKAAEPKKNDLWAAAKKGDAAVVEALLADGVDVNAATEYGVTALHFAADKGHLDVVRVLVEHKADVNVKDSFYGISAIFWAAQRRRADVMGVLLDAGAEGADDILPGAVAEAQLDVVRIVLSKGKLKQETLNRALASAPRDPGEIAELLEKAGAKLPAPVKRGENLTDYAGTYRNDDGLEYAVSLADDKLSLVVDDRPVAALIATGEDAFEAENAPSITFEFQRDGDQVTRFVMTTGPRKLTFLRSKPQESIVPKAVVDDDDPGEIVPQNWPSFRGLNASGVANGQKPPTVWDVEKGINLRWKTPIPGLGHSCPIVWEDRIYVTTAVRVDDGKSELKVGLYGDVESVEDASEHSWRTICLEKDSGRVLWDRVAHQGIPGTKRHTKGTHANCTPATDGAHIVVNFGSEGLYCYDREGRLLWHRDLGTLDSGWFYNADYQWGFASSPIIYRDRAIVQCDVGRDSFIAAYSITDGTEIWRTPREEIPSWGSPTLVAGPERTELVTNASKFTRGYDPLTGNELWRLSRHSEITVPTPIYGDQLIFVTSGYPPVKPIYAIRPGAAGDISLKEGETSNEFIAWSTPQGGPYMCSPIAYGGHLYVISITGIVTCYDAKTGKQAYKQRLPGKGAYTASPVAADGKIYLTSEENGVRVVKAGPEFELLAENPLGDVCLATPAISDGMLFFRTESQLLAVGRTIRQRKDQ